MRTITVTHCGHHGDDYDSYLVEVIDDDGTKSSLLVDECEGSLTDGENRIEISAADVRAAVEARHRMIVLARKCEREEQKLRERNARFDDISERADAVGVSRDMVVLVEALDRIVGRLDMLHSTLVR